MNKTNLEMVRGDTLAFGFEIEGVADIDTAFFSVKLNADEDDYIIKKSIGDGIAKVEDGKYSVRVAPEDTYNIPIGKYYYDLQIGVNGDIFTVLIGTLDIEADITREA